VKANDTNRIVEEVLHGNMEAYELLVNDHKQFVFNLVLGIVKNREDAEELTMDVFVKAYQKLSSFRGDSQFSTWLYTIAYRLSLMHLRKNKVKVEAYKDEFNQHTYNQRITDKSDIDLVLKTVISQLSKEDAALINLFYLKELNFKEIEDITNIKAGTAKVRIHRIKKKLAQHLENQFSAEELKTIAIY